MNFDLNTIMLLLYFFISLIFALLISFGMVRFYRRIFFNEYKQIKENYVLFVNNNEKNFFSLIFLSALYVIVDIFIKNKMILDIFIVGFLVYLLISLTIKGIDYLFDNFINIDFKKDIYIGYSTIGKLMKNLAKLVVIFFSTFIFLRLLKIDITVLYKYQSFKILFNLIFIFLIDLVFVLLGFLLYNIVKKILIDYALKTKTHIDDFVYRLLEMPLIFMFVFIGIKVSLNFLDLKDNVKNNLDIFSNCVIIIFLTILFLRGIDVFYREYVKKKKSNDNMNYSQQLGPLLKGIIKVVMVFIALVVILDCCGINVNSLIAGLGIGGVAVALAAQDTLSNFFGSISIFSDKPFKIGDRIKLNSYDGFVEEVGIRSTRVRTLDGSILSIPNSKLSKEVIENISLRDSIKVSVSIGLTYSVSSEEIEKGVFIIKNILLKYENNNNLKSNSIVFFNDFGAYSLNIQILFWINELDWVKAMQIKESIYLEIYKEFSNNNLDFAFPSQTIYVEKD